jgi:transcriptional regulator GlxA family with amidase domain
MNISQANRCAPASGSMANQVANRKIAIVLSEGCDLLAVSTIAEVLTRASDLSRRGSSPTQYEMHHLSATGGYVRCAPVMSVSTQAFSDVTEFRFDHVLLARGDGADTRSGDTVGNAWLQRMRNRGAAIRSLTAEAGGSPLMKDSTKAEAAMRTTKNRVSPALRAAFDIIRMDLGDQAAVEAMRLATGDDDLPFAINGARSPADKAHFAARWLRENCHRPLVVNDVADACALSERSLLRYFQIYLKTSPSEYLQRVRLELACEMLANTSLPADKIARRVGLNSGDRFGKILRRVTGMSPTEYRVSRLEPGHDDDNRADLVRGEFDRQFAL